MLEQTKKLFNDGYLEQACACFGFNKEQLNKLDGFESFVFEVETGNASYIMKITHSIRRTVDYLMGELEFVNYLAGHGVPCARAVDSVKGRMVETIEAEDGTCFLVYVFDKMEGRYSEYRDWSDDFVQHWGEFSGRMNALSREFKPSRESYRRQVWYEDDIYNFEKHISKEEFKTAENCRKIVEHVKSFPVDKESFGLIHGDFHQGNFYINDSKKIGIFDFDDCEYGFFVNDIAMPLFYATPGNDKKYDIPKEEFAEFFLSNFLKGYYREYQLERIWIERIPDFLRVRSAIMFALVDQIWAPDETNEKKTTFVGRHKNFINDNVPLIDIDFSKFAR